ncbi:MAG: hypothetical protein C3F11_13610 [Methylocystaceae bacterium]|nr:MAG: hypothetical protein C3F11_13610 [Methylocystaceae bacterium]
MTTLSSYLQIAGNLTKWRSIAAKSPDVAIQTKYFQDNIGKVKSVDDFLKDARLFDYAMTAFGLGDMTYAKGMMKKVLEDGVSSNSALANKLNNSNINAFAKAFDFAGAGAQATSSSTLVANVVGRYTEQALETTQGQENPGVRLALYFREHAPSVTSVYGILADKNLLTVVQTALGVSPLASAQPVDTQARLLKAKLDLSDFQDPKKLQNFITRFAAMYDIDNSSTSDSTISILFGNL